MCKEKDDEIKTVIKIVFVIISPHDVSFYVTKVFKLCILCIYIYTVYAFFLFELYVSI